MKKFISLFIGTLFVFGLAATAFAVHAEIPAETQAIVAKGTTQVTLSGNLRVRGWIKKDIASDAPADDAGASYYDQRVRLAADAVAGNVSGRIHLESTSGTFESNKDVYTWGNSDNKPTDVQILEAWINYKGEGLGFPAGIKVGHMPLSLGPVTLFYDHTKFGDDAIVLYADPTPETHVSLMTIKADEGATSDNTDDTDIYIAVLNHNVSGHALGLYYAYANNPDDESKIQDVGIHGKGTIAGLSYTAQADIQFGDVDAATDLSAYGVWVALGYKVDPVTIRAMFAYGSGDNDTDNDEETFQTQLGGNRYYTVVYDYSVVGATGARYKGIANTTVYNLGVDLAPMENLKVSLDAYALRASKAPAGISKSIGTEFDVKATYQLAKNLKYFVWGGYLSTGDFYEDAGLGTDDNPMVLMHGLEMAF